MTDQLKQLLNDMADEVKPTSLHADAARQSNRASVRNTVMAAVAALLIVGGGLVGVNGLGMSEPAEDVAGEPSPETGHRSPADYPDAQLDGVFYDGYFSQGDGESIFAWTADDPEPSAVVLGAPDSGYYHTGVISPDGQYIAYLQYGDANVPGGPLTGKVMVRDHSGEVHVEIFEYDKAEGVCSLPTWSPDGRLFVDHGRDADERYGFYDPDTGDFTPTTAPKGCGVKIAQDDNGDDLFIALEFLGGDTFDLTVTTTDGETTWSPAREKLINTLGTINYLTDVSADGRFACLRVSTGYSGDLERPTHCEYVVEIETGELVMALEGAVDDQAADESPDGVGNPASLAVPGHVLVYDRTTAEYKLADLNGQVVDSVPAALADGHGEPQLLDYVPAD